MQQSATQMQNTVIARNISEIRKIKSIFNPDATPKPLKKIEPKPELQHTATSYLHFKESLKTTKPVRVIKEYEPAVIDDNLKFEKSRFASLERQGNMNLLEIIKMDPILRSEKQ